MSGDVYDYMMERLRAYYIDVSASSGISSEMFDAVLVNQPVSPLDFDARLRALADFLSLPEAPALTAANKRIANILRQAADAPVAAFAEIDRKGNKDFKFDYEALGRYFHVLGFTGQTGIEQAASLFGVAVLENVKRRMSERRKLGAGTH